MTIRSVSAALIFTTAAGWAAVAPAQVERLNPNPTMPRDVGGRLSFGGHSGGGPRLGRAGSEENPAETMLRSIEGSNYGRATGRSIFSGPAWQPSTGNNIRRQPGSPATLYYAQRGAYEDRVYQPGKGSYRALERQQTYYRAQPRQPVHRTSPKAAPKRSDGQRSTERPGRAHALSQ